MPLANGRLLEQQIFRNIWVQPAASDSGCSLGIPFHIWHELLGHPRRFVMEHAYWGPEYSDADMQRGHSIATVSKARRVDDVERQTAKLLSDGHVIGWYQGRMEWGPRALGNRSILADPRRADMKDVINSKVKFREAYRPFAPSVLEEDVQDYFHFSGVVAVHDVRVPRAGRDDRRRFRPSHMSTGRRAFKPSHARTHPDTGALINEFKTLTGVPVVLNTSFNVKGEPIVCTPDDAVRCFLKTDLDFLVLGDTICSRG